MSVFGCDDTRKAYTGVSVNLPDTLEHLVLAQHTRDRGARLEHLLEAQTLLVEMLGDVQKAIAANTTSETVAIVARHIRGAAKPLTVVPT